jgi:photosystem II stability/assembly factor-like uncharacterized protein
MTFVRRLFLLGLSFLFGIGTARPQWIQSNNGLQNLNVRTVAISNSILLLGTEKGIYHSTNAGDSWSRIGLDTSEIYDIAVEGERIFVLAISGMYLSTLSGQSWQEVSPTGWPAKTRAASVGMRGSLLWVGTAYTGVNGRDPLIYTTTDSGLTWSAQSSPVAFGGGGDTREMNPIVVSGPDLFASLRYRGTLSRSTDDGKVWIPTAQVPLLDDNYRNNFPGFAVEDSTIFVLVNSNLPMSVFRSTNKGLDWVETRSGLPRGYTTGAVWRNITMHGPVVYITSDSAEFGTVRPTVYRTTNNGTSWIDIGSGLGHHNSGGIAQDSHAVYLGTRGGGVYKHSFDMEASLQITMQQEDPFGLLGPTGRVKLYKDTVLLGEKRAGANSVLQFDGLPEGWYSYRAYADRATPWGEQYWGEKLVNVVASTVVHDVHKHSTPFMSDVRMYIDSTNELLVFGSPRTIPPGTRLRVEVDVTNPDYEGSRPAEAHIMIHLDADRSLPHDISLTSIDQTFGVGQTRKAVFFPVVTQDGSYYLTCGAYTSFAGGHLLTDGGGWIDPAFTVRRVPDSPLLAYPSENGANLPTTLIFRWRPVLNALNYHLQLATDSMFTPTLVLNDSMIVDTSYATSQLANGTTYFWRVRARTTNNFSQFSSPWRFKTLLALPEQVQLTSPASGVDVSMSTVGFVWRKTLPEVTRYWFEISTDSQFVFRAIDSTGADTFFVKQALANGMYWWKVRAYNASGWGQYSNPRTFTVRVTGLEETTAVPHEYLLGQNFPNPFNPATTIRYGLPKAEVVLLKVLNSLGQEVLVLLNGEQHPGYHEVRFDGSNLPSGMYFYRIQAGPFRETKRLLLIR